MSTEQGSTIASRALHPYASEAYASAFNLDRVWLPNTKTYVLLRPIPNSDRRDATGCYPLCVLEGLKGMDEDLALLAAQGVVSLVLVTDCLTQPPEGELSKRFDLCRPYKTHHVYDARLPNADYSKHHRDRIRRALRFCETRVVDLGEHLDSWMACYNTLIEKKGITGIQAFSADYFAKLATIPGFVTIGTFLDGAFVSGHIWLRHKRVAYAHLAASIPKGYKLSCAFPIWDHGIRLLRDECVIDLGGGAGVESDGKDSLSEFKRGFANAERRNFLCGKILDACAYRDLCRARGMLESDNYFPAYRAPVPSPPSTVEESP